MQGFRLFLLLPWLVLASRPCSAELPWIGVAEDKRSFVAEGSHTKFVPWGFNYDHDARGRLIEDYWDQQWSAIEADFREMKQLGANVVRIHLQLAKFMTTPQKANEHSLDQLERLVNLAERTGLYLDLTGLGCYHRQDVPVWYDELDEQERWNVQARFWESIARKCAGRSAVFCYDLMNEPVVPGGSAIQEHWLGPAFAGKHFVQFITRDRKDRLRPEIARQWIHQLVAAIRRHDRRHLITVGLVPWSLERPGLTSGFAPAKIAKELDFLAVHIYPETGKLDEALKTLEGFAVGKPILIEEMFPLRCSPEELDKFIDLSRRHAAGWIGFYWGKTPEEYRNSRTIAEAITLGWLELFREKSTTLGNR